MSFVDCTLSNHVVLIARHPVPYALTFSGGSLSVGTKSGTTAVDAKGPTNATFSGFTFTRTAQRTPGPLWAATGGARLVFVHSVLPELPPGDANAWAWPDEDLLVGVCVCACARVLVGVV